jgi:hypothetical protein
MPAATAGQDVGSAAGRSAVPSDGPGDGTGGAPEQLIVNVTGRASRALDMAAELTGDTRTDTLNRALQVYLYLEQVIARGGSIHIREAGPGPDTF